MIAGDGDGQLYALKIVATGIGPVSDLGGAHGQLDTRDLLVLEEGLVLDVHVFAQWGEKFGGVANAHMGAETNPTLPALLLFICWS